MVVVVVLGWLILCFIIASLGSQKKIGGVAAFFVALIFSPIIGFIVVLASSNNNSQNTVIAYQNARLGTLTNKALNKYRSKEYYEALNLFKQGLDINPNERNLHFNVASIYSLLNDKENSFLHLKRAIDLGYSNFSKIKSSEDLIWLRQQTEFSSFFTHALPINSTEKTAQNYLDDLKKLADLKANEVITEKEFETEKLKLLSNR
jgi:tetratricopeptide (TPR) repeat protein